MIIEFVKNSLDALKGYPVSFHNPSDLNDARDLKNLIQLYPSSAIDTDGKVYLVVRAFNVPNSKDSLKLKYGADGDCQLFVEDFSCDEVDFREFLFQLQSDVGKVTFLLGKKEVSYTWEKVSTFTVALTGFSGVLFADSFNREFFKDVQSEIEKLELYLTFCPPMSVDWAKKKIAKLKALVN
jgi:hypothetical protein